ncbi:von Willebrand factor type A domain protein [Posidoniimonas corsicana]|uniref:von Willebrand factor type A domain protein n=1 Tax=Posidoniimonas corsicana TaxID=1938618 RepID=A0A5C5UV99_9BACT|nr:VWA domain-containing protein [Posidoniimonas corsicana]TWT30306.1 von Willebrand factor type A domain protein [Posidoniimonas corsicana]
MPHTLRHCRRGAMLPLIAFLLPVLVIFLGFAVDLAYMQNARLELRATTDAAARAAATTLSRTDSVGKAKRAAKRIARRNRVAGLGLELRDSDIEFGRSEPDRKGRYHFTPGAEPLNAVRVTGDRTAGSPTGSVALFFSNLYGGKSFEPTFVSTASFLSVDVCLVLDRSGSMRGQKLRDLQDAVEVFLQELESTNAVEQVALASYSSSAKTELGLTTDYSEVRKKVDKFNASGMTAIGEGLRHGIKAAIGPGHRVTAEPMIILMTDGLHNTGIGPMSYADDAAEEGIKVYTVTFGAGADKKLMRDVASATGGRYMHADNREELIAVFRELAAQASQITN